MTRGHPTYLLDTTVLSNFAHVRRADLPLRVLGPHLAVTPGVLAELRAGEQAGLVPTCDWTCLAVITPTTAELATASALERQLDPGEAECLAVALQRGYRFLSDDFAARRLAKAQGISVMRPLLPHSWRRSRSTERRPAQPVLVAIQRQGLQHPGRGRIRQRDLAFGRDDAILLTHLPLRPRTGPR